MTNEPVQRPLWSKGWCKGCLASTYCGAEHTECHPFHRYPNEVLRPDHPDLLHWVAREARGLQFDDVVGRRVNLPALPAYVAQVERGLHLASTDLPFVALTLKDIFSRKQLRPVTPIAIRHTLGLPSSRRILLGVAKDDLIERIWGQQDFVYDTIAALGFDLVTAFNYSISRNEPRLEHLVSLKRSLLTFERLQAAGVPAIPHVYWYSTPDLRRWAAWLSQNPVEMVAINLQTAKPETTWLRLLRGVEWIADNFPGRLRYLIIGPCTWSRMRAIQQLLPRVTFSNKDAYVLATKRRRKTWDGQEFRLAHEDTDPSVLLRQNAALITAVAEGRPPQPRVIVDFAGHPLMEQLAMPYASY